MKTVFANGSVITLTRILPRANLVVEGGKILGVSQGEAPADAEIIDCAGQYVSPGFVDIHLHGGGGADVCDATPDAVRTVAATHARYGTTAMLPATESVARDTLLAACDAVNAARANSGGAEILGIHLEGNYFSQKQRGAQNPAYIYPPVKAEYEEILERAGCVRMVSAAPEIENALDFGRDLTARGIVMSIGHSDATYPDVLRAIDAGYSHVTHIYNGNSWLNSPYYYCQIGVCEAGLLHDELTVEAIADGRHLPPQLLQLIYKIKGPDKMHLCTDACCAADMPEGNYSLGGLPCMVEDSVAMLTDRSSFAGSVATANRLVRTVYREANVPLVDAVRMISATPAKVIGEGHRKGRLAPGYDADVVVFDENIDVHYVMIAGSEYKNELKKENAK